MYSYRSNRLLLSSYSKFRKNVTNCNSLCPDKCFRENKSYSQDRNNLRCFTTYKAQNSSYKERLSQFENDIFYESGEDLPGEAKVIIYGDELVSKSLAFHLADTLGSNVVVISGAGPGKKKSDLEGTLNSFVVNHMIVSNPRSSLLIHHSTELFNMTKTGSIYLAQTEERVKSLKRMISISKLFIPREYGTMELLSPEGNLLNCHLV